MHFLLISLSNETFRGDIGFWQNISYFIIFVGTATFLSSLAVAPFKNQIIESRIASKYFGYSALINAVMAAAFTLPLFYPPLDFPILITEWPGMYMIIAYAFFIIFGVLGMFAWSLSYSSLAAVLSKGNFSRPIVIFQLAISNLGVYGMAISLFLGGYLGSYLAYNGAGSIIVGASMEFSDIPAAFSIFLCIISVFVGVANFIRTE